MQDYDGTLKQLLQTSAASVLRQLTGMTITRWLSAEIPRVKTMRADLLGETADGHLIHIELQASNDPLMALRMAEYALLIYRKYARYPRQIVLYVGAPPLRMPASLTEPDAENPDFVFKYRLIDIRDLDGADLLASPHIKDNVLAILTRWQDKVDVIRQILARIAKLKGLERRAALAVFLIISELRLLASTIEEEAEKMPILLDIMDHSVIGPAIRKGLQQGLEQGRQEGRKQALQGTLARMIKRKFGSLPTRVKSRLAKLSEPELDDLALRLLDASTLEELFPKSR
jgi:predicted transposase YdaD